MRVKTEILRHTLELDLPHGEGEEHEERDRNEEDQGTHLLLAGVADEERDRDAMDIDAWAMRTKEGSARSQERPLLLLPLAARMSRERKQQREKTYRLKRIEQIQQALKQHGDSGGGQHIERDLESEANDSNGTSRSTAEKQSDCRQFCVECAILPVSV